MERWRAVKNYEGIYLVSDQGRVMRTAPSYGTRPGIVLKPCPIPSGYLNILLSKDGTQTSFHLHTVVAEAFLGPCPEGCEINHIDGDKTNNRASNLEYLSRLDNVRHALFVLDNGFGNLTEEGVTHIRRLYARGGLTYNQLAERYGVSRTTIGSIVRRTTYDWVDDGIPAPSSRRANKG